MGGNQRRNQLVFWGIFVILAGLPLVGCIGVGYLRVVNNYPFDVLLRDRNENVIGVVRSHTTQTMSGAAGYKGDAIDGMTIENASHKLRLTINRDSPNVENGESRRFSTSEWSVTLGSPPPNNPLPIGWIAAGLVLLIGWVEWRAHKNEKTTRLP